MSRLFLVFTLLAAQVLLANPVKSQLQKATEQAQRLLKSAVVDTAKHYCLKGTLTCRSIFTYKTHGGMQLKHFVQVFMSSDRQVGSSGYFFPNLKQPGQYHRYEDMNLNGKIEFNEETPGIMVERGADNSVTKMIGMRLDMLGTRMFVMSDLIFNEDKVVLEGIKYDANKPGFKESIRIEYLRVYP